ncbi:MAG TPA: type II secretion system protein [Acidobacteriota bacterium]|jgi:prepilin-type N-terminal cleavage/methylation domain-containing protein|nr:type II secretion system protein [Acidobacteriota bacterium]HRR57706.1 type II secretion system protein [Acidobacteriota bacterium]HRV09583.1 type II secretion system protein [Acidobacteriota bacterium]
MRRQQGFSLIELLIVVAVIGIIAAIAVPNLLRSRQAAQEASAISSLRTLATAEITYAATQGRGSFGTLDQLQTAGLIDELLGGGGPKDGYTFACNNTAQTFECTATPEDPGENDLRRTLVVREDCVIRDAADDTPLGGTPTAAP